MIKLKLAKAFVLGMSLTVISSAAVYAEEGGGQSAAYQGQTTEINSKLLQKQSEIDKYVFEDQAKEIEDKGFMITHTGPARRACRDRHYTLQQRKCGVPV